MMREDIHDDPVDELVRSFLSAEADRTDPAAFLARLKERRQRSARVIRLRAPLLAAAAVVVAALGASLLLRQPVGPGQAGRPDLRALYGLEATLREELLAAWQGARGGGKALVSAGEAPLADLADVRLSVPGLPVLLGLLDAIEGPVPPLSKENER
jgi:hypothetical protein